MQRVNSMLYIVLVALILGSTFQSLGQGILPLPTDIDTDLTSAISDALTRLPKENRETFEVNPYYIQQSGDTAHGQVLVHYSYTSDLNGIRFVAIQQSGIWAVSFEKEMEYSQWMPRIEGVPSATVRSTAYDRSAAISWAAQAGGPIGDATFWNQRGNYRDGHARGVGCSSWAGCDIGRHCTTFIARALNSGGLNVDWGFVGNHQLIEWMNANPDKWSRMYDYNQLEAGDFILINWKRAGQTAITTWADHSVLVTGSNQYAQWNSETWGNSISGLLQNAFDWWGIHINTAVPVASNQLVSSDYDGDGRVDLSTKANNGEWRIDFAANGFDSWDATFTGMGDNTSFYLSGDFNGDGKSDLSMKSPGGEFYIDLAPSFGNWDQIHSGMGDNSSIYMVGDFNGDGKSDLSMKAPGGEFYIDLAPSFGNWDQIYSGMGDNSSIYIVGDFNGDGADDLSMKSPTGDWYIDLSPTFGNWDHIFHGYGDNSNTYHAGNYDADNGADLFMVAPNGDLYVDYACNGFGSWDPLNLDCTNLLTNGGFEIAGSTSRLALAWKDKNLLSKGKRMCNTTEKPVVTAEGECLFQFKGGSMKGPSYKLKQMVVAAGRGNTGEVLTLNAQVAGKKFQIGAKITLKVVYTDNTAAKLNITIPNGTYPFTSIEGILALAKPLKQMVVTLNIKEVSGRLQVDDVQLALSPAARLRSALTLPSPASVTDGFRNSN
jgi:hypothetical protein